MAVSISAALLVTGQAQHKLVDARLRSEALT